jgi:HEAT repeat protein
MTRPGISGGDERPVPFDFGAAATREEIAAIPALIKKLKDPSPEVRVDAARRLGFLGSHAKPAVPFLEKLLDDPLHLEVFDAATIALLQIDYKRVDQRVRKHKEYTSQEHKMESIVELAIVGLPLYLSMGDKQAVEAMLGILRTHGQFAAPRLAVNLDQGNPMTRRVAARALLILDPSDARIAIDALVKALRDEDEPTSQMAAETLSKIAPERPEVVPWLIQRLGHESCDAQWFAAQQLARNASPAAIAALAGALQSESAETQMAVVVALSEAGPNARGAVGALRAAARKASEIVSVAIEEALRNINRSGA